MKKQFLHETHNLQEKAKKLDYRERFQDEGDVFDRGGIVQTYKPDMWFKGNTIHFNVKAFLNEDKQSVIQTLAGWKFSFSGKVGTIRQLEKYPEFTDAIRERVEMTKRSLRRTSDIIGDVKHPKKNRMFPLLEFTCFLEPVEPFSNLLFKRDFAFQVNIPKSRS